MRVHKSHYQDLSSPPAPHPGSEQLFSSLNITLPEAPLDRANITNPLAGREVETKTTVDQLENFVDTLEIGDNGTIIARATEQTGANFEQLPRMLQTYALVAAGRAQSAVEIVAREGTLIELCDLFRFYAKRHSADAALELLTLNNETLTESGVDHYGRVCVLGYLSPETGMDYANSYFAMQQRFVEYDWQYYHQRYLLEGMIDKWGAQNTLAFIRSEESKSIQYCLEFNYSNNLQLALFLEDQEAGLTYLRKSYPKPESCIYPILAVGNPEHALVLSADVLYKAAIDFESSPYYPDCHHISEGSRNIPDTLLKYFCAKGNSQLAQTAYFDKYRLECPDYKQRGPHPEYPIEDTIRLIEASPQIIERTREERETNFERNVYDGDNEYRREEKRAEALLNTRHW